MLWKKLHYIPTCSYGSDIKGEVKDNFEENSVELPLSTLINKSFISFQLVLERNTYLHFFNWTFFLLFFFHFPFNRESSSSHQRKMCEGRVGSYLSASLWCWVTRILSARKRNHYIHKEETHLEHISISVPYGRVWKPKVHFVLSYFWQKQPEGWGHWRKEKRVKMPSCLPFYLPPHPFSLYLVRLYSKLAKLISRILGFKVGDCRAAILYI